MTSVFCTIVMADQSNCCSCNSVCSGRIVFDTSKWTGEKVAELIDDMGFEAKLLGMFSCSLPTLYFRGLAVFWVLLRSLFHIICICNS